MVDLAVRSEQAVGEDCRGSTIGVGTALKGDTVLAGQGAVEVEQGRISDSLGFDLDPLTHTAKLAAVGPAEVRGQSPFGVGTVGGTGAPGADRALGMHVVVAVMMRRVGDCTDVDAGKHKRCPDDEAGPDRLIE